LAKVEILTSFVLNLLSYGKFDII